MRVQEIERIIQTIYQKIQDQLILKPTISLANNVSKYSEEVQMRLQKTHWVESSKEAKACLVSSLTIQELSEISQLHSHNPETELILYYLLQGKPVYVIQSEIEDYIKERKSKYHLWKSLVEIKRTCENYGLVFLDSEEIEMIFSDLTKKIDRFEQSTYITEEMLKKYHQSNTIDKQLPESYRLTPLAQDYALEHGLNL